MNDEQAIAHINELKSQCHALVEKLARHRYAASLLSKTVGWLEAVIAYKSNRKYHRPGATRG